MSLPQPDAHFQPPLGDAYSQERLKDGDRPLSKHMHVAQSPTRWLNSWARGFAMPHGDAEQYLRKERGGETALAKAKLPPQGAENRAPNPKYWAISSGLPKIGKGRVLCDHSPLQPLFQLIRALSAQVLTLYYLKTVHWAHCNS